MKTALLTIRRKYEASLLMRPLSHIVDPDDVVEGEYLSTIMVVIPEAREEEFLQNYSRFHTEMTLEDFLPGEVTSKKGKDHALDTAHSQEGIYPAEEGLPAEESALENDHIKSRAQKLMSAGVAVPGSANLLIKDGGMALYRILVIGAGAEAFRSVCRRHKYTVRYFKYDPEESRLSEKAEKDLKLERSKRWRKLVHWCQASFSDAVRGWLHLKSIRLFVESVLRYGLPVNFDAYLLVVQPAKEKVCRVALGQLYQGISGANLIGSGDVSEMDFSGLGADFFPYVYLNVDPWVQA